MCKDEKMKKKIKGIKIEAEAWKYINKFRKKEKQ